MKKMNWLALILVGALLSTGCENSKESAKPVEETTRQEEQATSAEETATETVTEQTTKTESDESLAKKVEALMTMFNQQTINEEKLPYLVKARTLIEKMERPTIQMVIVNLNQMMIVESNVQKKCDYMTHLDWAYKQLEKVDPETTSIDECRSLLSLEFIWEGIKLLKDSPQEIQPYLERIYTLLERVAEAQKDSPDLVKIESVVQAPMAWMLAQNAILYRDYQKADRFLTIAENIYQKEAKKYESLLAPKDKEETKKLIEKIDVALQEPEITDEDRKELEELKIEFQKEMDAEPYSWENTFAHVTFLRAFILYGTDKTEEALQLFRKGIKNDFNYTSKLYSKYLWKTFDVFQFRGEDISGLQPIRDELEEALKDYLTKGLEVKEVLSDSIAEKGGIQVGDRIMKYDGRYVCDVDDFSIQRWADEMQGIEKTVKVELLSNGETKEIEVPAGRLGVVLRSEEEKPTEE